MRSEAEVREMYQQWAATDPSVVKDGIVLVLLWILEDAGSAGCVIRPKGFYWIKTSGGWQIAEWEGARFRGFAVADDKVQEVGERIPDHE